jgi:hypothetical protein
MRASCDWANALASISASLVSATRSDPGSELMIEVFRLAGASVILLDEPVMFARQLDDARLSVGLVLFERQNRRRSA